MDSITYIYVRLSISYLRVHVHQRVAVRPRLRLAQLLLAAHNRHYIHCGPLDLLVATALRPLPARRRRRRRGGRLHPAHGHRGGRLLLFGRRGRAAQAQRGQRQVPGERIDVCPSGQGRWAGAGAVRAEERARAGVVAVGIMRVFRFLKCEYMDRSMHGNALTRAAAGRAGVRGV